MRKATTQAFLVYCVLCATQLSAATDSQQRHNATQYQSETPVWKTGATNTMYNASAGLPWKHQGGDWIDKGGTEQGTIPFSTFQSMTTGQVSADVTPLIKGFITGIIPNNGIFIKGRKGSAIANFYSLESENKARVPRLMLTTEHGKNYTISATADTHLDPTTRRPLDSSKKLKLNFDNRPMLIFFPLGEIPSNVLITKAELLLHMSKRYGNKPVIAEIYAIDQRKNKRKQTVQYGLAKDYTRDVGLEKNPEVILVEKFDSSHWTSDWSETGGNLLLVDDQSLVVPLDGNALQIQFKKGSKTAANITYKFSEKTGSEPESIYFRYYIFLSENWNPAVGGKFPGIAGTYGKAGWGGRKSDGFNGWSTRGAYKIPMGSINPLHGLTPIGTYAYTADMKGRYGNYWSWPIGLNGLLERKRWYAIEQYVQLNTPGEQNGILKSWIDGRLAFEKTNIMYRRTKELKVDRIWINFYHGGTTVIPSDQDIYIDNVVIAKQYIGPMRHK